MLKTEITYGTTQYIAFNTGSIFIFKDKFRLKWFIKSDLQRATEIRII